MGNLLESLKHYFEHTPPEVIEKDWNEVSYLNEIGPDAIEYAEYVRKYLDANVSYSSAETKGDTHKYAVLESYDSSQIAADSPYCLAA